MIDEKPIGLNPDFVTRVRINRCAKNPAPLAPRLTDCRKARLADRRSQQYMRRKKRLIAHYNESKKRLEAQVKQAIKALLNRVLHTPDAAKTHIIIDGQDCGAIIEAMALQIKIRSSRGLSTSEKHLQAIWSEDQIRACSCHAVRLVLTGSTGVTARKNKGAKT